MAGIIRELVLLAALFHMPQRVPGTLA
jgi:hypothetical protein